MLKLPAIILSPFLIVALSVGLYSLICFLRSEYNHEQSPDPHALFKPIILKTLPMLLFTVIFMAGYRLLPMTERLLPFSALCLFVLCANVDILSGFLPFELVGLLVVQYFIIREIFQFDLPLFGFAGCIFCMLAIYLFGKKAFPAESAPFGLGDVWFGSIIGLYFGFPTGLKVIAVGLILNGIFAFILRLLFRDRLKTLPLTPGFVLAILPFIPENLV